MSPGKRHMVGWSPWNSLVGRPWTRRRLVWETPHISPHIMHFHLTALPNWYTRLTLIYTFFLVECIENDYNP